MPRSHQTRPNSRASSTNAGAKVHRREPKNVHASDLLAQRASTLERNESRGLPAAAAAAAAAADRQQLAHSHSAPTAAAAPPAPAAFGWIAFVESVLADLDEAQTQRVERDRVVNVLRTRHHTSLDNPGNVCDALARVFDEEYKLFLLPSKWAFFYNRPPAPAPQAPHERIVNVFTVPITNAGGLHFWAPVNDEVQGLRVFFLESAAKGIHMRRLGAGWTPQFITDVASEVAGVVSTKVVVLHGESGSGKSLTAMLSACLHPTSCDGALCVCVIPDDVGPLPASTDLCMQNGRFVKARDTEFERVFFTKFEDALQKMWNFLAAESQDVNKELSGTAQKGHVTILFDEFGPYSEAIRSICASQDTLIASVRAKLRLGAAVTVQIIVAGTGAQGGTHMVGSMPQTFHLRTVAPMVWENTRPKKPRRDATASDIFAFHVCVAVDERKSRAANAAWRMVSTNARACAIFRYHLSLLKDGGGKSVSPKLLRDLVVKTAAAFKSLNGLETLQEEAYRQQYIRAVALSLYGAKEDPSADLSPCFKQYGMVTDRAVLVDGNEQNGVVIHTYGDTNHVLCLPSSCNGQRYYLSEAQIVVAQTVIGLGDREYSGEGFEELVADLLVHAAMVAPWLKGKVLLQPATPAAPWVHTLQLLAEIVKSAGETNTVMRARLKQKIEPTAAGGRIGDKDKGIIDAAAMAGVDAVLLNADKAAFADLFFKQGRGQTQREAATLWLVQIKRYESTVLTADAAMEELFKMGDLRGWPEHMIQQLPTDDASTGDKWLAKANATLKSGFESVSLPFAPFAMKTLRDRALLKASLASQTGNRTIHADAAMTKIGGRGCDVKRALFVWGKSPQANVQPPSPDTLLVHARDPDDAKVLAASPALGGLYPFSAKDADFSVLKLPIDRPARA